MINSKSIPKEVLEIFEYSENSPSGLLYKIDIYNSRGFIHTRKGLSAGTVLKDKSKKPKSWQINTSFGKFSAHRVVWNLFNGEIPKGLVIDHIDGNPLNNNIKNLRVVSQAENNRNSARDHFRLNCPLPNGVSIRDVANGSRSRKNLYFVVTWSNGEKEKFRYFNAEKLGLLVAHRDSVMFRKSKEFNLSQRHGV